MFIILKTILFSIVVSLHKRLKYLSIEDHACIPFKELLPWGLTGNLSKSKSGSDESISVKTGFLFGFRNLFLSSSKGKVFFSCDSSRILSSLNSSLSFFCFLSSLFIMALDRVDSEGVLPVVTPIDIGIFPVKNKKIQVKNIEVIQFFYLAL